MLFLAMESGQEERRLSFFVAKTDQFPSSRAMHRQIRTFPINAARWSGVFPLLSQEGV